MNAGCTGNIFVNMANEQKEQNLLLKLSNRRHENARMQLKSAVLECYELFGETFTNEVLDECKSIFEEFKNF